jgi:hypothetical protein
MRKFLSLIVIAIFTNACASNTPASNPLSADDQIATIVAATLSAMNTQPSATEVPATPTTMPFPGTPVSYNKINLVIPPTIASGISGSIIPRTEADGAPWGGEPEHIEVDLNNFLLQGPRAQPRIYIYPAEEFATLQVKIADNIANLNKIIETPDQQLTDEILPTRLINAAQLFASNRKVIPFRNGQGVRYITQYAQYPAPINNHDLVYYFSGLTDNKKFYIMVILPINTNQLPENAQLGATQPAGGLYLPPDLNSATESDLQKYYLDITTLLDNTQADAFTPSIDLLDASINSINIIDG